MFFAVFGVIVLTEIFLIDERGRGAGVLVRHGGRRRGEKPDYEDSQSILQASLVYIGQSGPTYRVKCKLIIYGGRNLVSNIVLTHMGERRVV
jgi:hypothetical protein